MFDNTSANYRYHFAVFNTKPLVYHISPHIAQGYCVYDRLIGGEAVIIVAGLDSFPPNRRFLLVNRREKIGQLTKTARSGSLPNDFSAARFAYALMNILNCFVRVYEGVKCEKS